MTVNTSQGQSLTRVGVYSVKDFFSHGQLYVAASRVGNPEQFRILMLNHIDNTKCKEMINVIYKEILT
jgi:ATP-dependent DNA helicase PIF1